MCTNQVKEDQAEVVEPPLPPWDPRGPQPADPGAPGENVNNCNECDQDVNDQNYGDGDYIDDAHRSGRRGQLESREGGSREEEADRQRLEGQCLQSVSTLDGLIGGDENTYIDGF